MTARNSQPTTPDSQSPERFRWALDSASDAIYLIDRARMRFIECNEAAYRNLGYSREELLELGPQDITPKYTRDDLAREFDAILAHPLQYACIETLHRHRDGSLIPVEVRLRGVGPDESTILVAVARDLTRRRNEERLLRESDERFRQLAENIQDVFWIRDIASNRMLYVSPAYERIWGRPIETLYARPRAFLAGVHPDDLERVQTAITLQNLDDRWFNEQYRVIHPDGSVRWVRARTFPVRDETGQVYRVVGVVEDITELKESETQYRAIVEASMDGFVKVDEQGRLLDMNEAFCRLIGYARDDLLAMRITELEARESPEEVAEHIRKIILIGQDRFETQWRAKDGRILDIEISAYFRTSKLGGRISVFSRDISERITLERRRLEAERAQREVLVREVHHRIKNNLQGVVGLLNDYIDDHPETAEAIGEAIQQVNSIAIVHGLQSQDAHGRINLIAMLEEITAALRTMASCDIRMTLGGSRPEALLIHAEKAVSVALILNELIYNAIKHGSVLEPRRQVEIVLDVGQDFATLRITTPGVTLPAGFDFHHGKGLGTGLSLVRTLIPRPCAHLDLRNESCGVVAELTLCPTLLASGSEPGAIEGEPRVLHGDGP